MRALVVVALLGAGSALADVGPRPPKCVVPAECVTCGRSLADADSGVDCRVAALDAGLSLSSCTDQSGVGLSEYYCPKGKQAVRGCGCAGVDGGLLVGAAAVLTAWRRRGRAARAR